MVLLTHVPPPPLQPWVGVAHGYEAPANPTGLHRGLPSRYLTLVVEVLAPLRVAGVGPAVTAHAVVGGLRTRPALIDASLPQTGLQYGLTPLGAGVLLGAPAGELSGLTLDLAELWGAGADELVDRVRAAPGWTERFALVDAALLRRLSGQTCALPGELAEAWRCVFDSDGRIRVAALAAHIGWSRRHLTDRFRRATGLTAKQAARVARFEAVRRLLLAPGRPGLADVAAVCGYADQAHLARDWHDLAGCTVSAWLREELPFVQDAPPVDQEPSLP